MKKILLSLVAVVMVIAVANAQTSFGVRAGANLANIGGDDTDDAKMKIGYHVGAYANIGLTDMFALEPGLFLSSKGYKVEESETEEFMGEVMKYEYEGKSNITYLDIPVLARISTASGFNVFVGPQFSFLLGNKYKEEETMSTGGVTETESDEDSSTEGMNKLDLGLALGVGYQLESGLNFNLGYDLGLSNINDFEGSEDYKVHNRVIKISVGFNF